MQLPRLNAASPAAPHPPSAKHEPAERTQEPTRNAGLPSCRPSARVNSAFVTGFGAVTFNGPEMSVRSRANRTAATASLSADPAHPLTPISDPRAKADPERRQHLLERRPLRHRARRRNANARRGFQPDAPVRPRLPLLAQTREKTAARAPMIHPDFIPAVAIDPDCRGYQKSLRGVAQSGQRRCKAACRVDPAGDHLPVDRSSVQRCARDAWPPTDESLPSHPRAARRLRDCRISGGIPLRLPSPAGFRLTSCRLGIPRLVSASPESPAQHPGRSAQNHRAEVFGKSILKAWVVLWPDRRFDQID